MFWRMMSSLCDEVFKHRPDYETGLKANQSLDTWFINLFMCRNCIAVQDGFWLCGKPEIHDPNLWFLFNSGYYSEMSDNEPSMGYIYSYIVALKEFTNWVSREDVWSSCHPGITLLYLQKKIQNPHMICSLYSLPLFLRLSL